MLAAFICANIYGVLHVCQIQTNVTKQGTEYRVLLTDNRWYKVNGCTAYKAKIGKPFKERKQAAICI